jgi:catechol 2,3-dioxygenase-like lactoylglutathione lyase family enzyme
MSAARLGHVAIEVRDLARSIAFYREVVGATPVARDEPHRIVMLRAGASDRFHDLALHEVSGEGRKPGGAAHVAWEVDDVAALAAARDALAAHDALRWAADFGMARSIFGVDPDGHAIEITCVGARADWPRWERDGTGFVPLSTATLEPKA